MEDLHYVHVDHSVKSMNFEYKVTLRVNGRTHITP